MNENINIAPQESKLVIYLVVAAKVIVYILLMLGFAGCLGTKKEAKELVEDRWNFERSCHAK